MVASFFKLMNAEQWTDTQQQTDATEVALTLTRGGHYNPVRGVANDFGLGGCHTIMTNVFVSG